MSTPTITTGTRVRRPEDDTDESGTVTRVWNQRKPSIRMVEIAYGDDPDDPDYYRTTRADSLIVVEVN